MAGQAELNPDSVIADCDQEHHSLMHYRPERDLGRALLRFGFGRYERIVSAYQNGRHNPSKIKPEIVLNEEPFCFVGKSLILCTLGSSLA